MRVKLKLSNDLPLVEPVCDLAFRLGINSGLSEEKATKLSLIVDELLTDIILFGFEPGEVQDITMTFISNPDGVEVIVREMGEPFDPNLHRYSPERAAEGNFEGAGLEVINAFSDEFLFLNRGKEGKEYRILVRTEHPIVTGLFRKEELLREPERTANYCISPIGEGDAEDISKLIYRTYRYSYPKEEMYYPEKVRGFIRSGKKFGVIVRTAEGEAVGYFAVIRMPDSNIGEIGEAVVSPGHRGRGIMKMMIDALIGMARERKLSALFGEAVTVHTISQKVNMKFGFRSTALLLGAFPPSKIVGLRESYPQRVSVVVDFLSLKPLEERTVFVPGEYRNMVRRIYRNLGTPVRMGRGKAALTDKSRLSFSVNYSQGTAVIVVKHAGEDLGERVKRKLSVLMRKGIKVIYADLPVESPRTPEACRVLRDIGFIFAGILPLFHRERDYLRVQFTRESFDFSKIEVLSDTAKSLKRFVKREYRQRELGKE